MTNQQFLINVFESDDINYLIYYAECVVGYFSNSLIEASIMNKKIIRVLIDLKNHKFDTLKNMKVGIAVYDVEQLISIIKDYEEPIFSR